MIKTVIYSREDVSRNLPSSLFNLIIGRSGTGKTMFLKLLFSRICHVRTGVPIEEITRQMMLGDISSINVDMEIDGTVDGTVFYFPSFGSLFYEGEYKGLPLHLRKTIGVYNSWVNRGYNFDQEVREKWGITGTSDGILKIKIFLAILKEIKVGDVLLVDLPEAGLDPILWKWWIDKIVDLIGQGVQLFMTTHDFFIYTYVRSNVENGVIYYFKPDDIQVFSMLEGLPEDAPILRIPIEVLESAM